MDRAVAFAQQSDPRLLALALVLALSASVVSLNIFQARRGRRGQQRWGWIFLAAASCAFGLWAANYVSLIAHGTDVPRAYDWLLTTASLLSVMLLTCAGFAIAGSGSGWKPALGGAVNGGGIGLMHYIGFYAVVLPGEIVWNLPLVLASLVFGIGFNAASLAALQNLRGRTALWVAAVLLTLGLAALYVTGMHAASVRHRSHVGDRTSRAPLGAGCRGRGGGGGGTGARLRVDVDRP